MELVQIKHFINIVECGSMLAASEKYHVSQSTLSYAIKQIENELEVKIFERAGRNLRLTDAGEEFYSGAIRLEEEYLALLRKVSSYEGKMSPLRIAIDIVDYGTECTRIYRRLYPDAMIECRKVPSAAGMSEDIIKGKTDLIISTSSLEGTSSKRTGSITSELLLEEPLLLFISSRHPYAQRESVYIGDLADQTLITQPLDFEYRKNLERMLKEAGVRPANVIEYNDTETCALYAQSGRGVMLIPESVRGYQLQGDNPFNNDKAVAIPVIDEICRRKVWLSMRSDRTDDNSIRAFAAFCHRYSSFIYDNKRLPGDDEL